jgi:hypothetical protein
VCETAMFPQGAFPRVFKEVEELMRRYGLSLGLALALSGLVYSGSASAAWPGACAVGTSVHNHARIMLKGKTLAKCMSDANGCKCVSCYDLSGAVYSACYALVAPMPH